MCHEKFPDGYYYLDKLDLQKNKSLFWLVNLLSLLLLIAVVAVGCFIVNPLTIPNDKNLLIGLAVFIVSLIAYIFLHEAVHGIFMYSFSKVKPKYGFAGWAAYAGSSAYFDKPSYMIISLAPLVTFGIIFGVLAGVFHTGIWFWVLWGLQAMNFSGASGDIFVFFKMFTYPKDIQVNDTGMAMTIFRRKTEEELAAETELIKTGDSESD